MTIHPTADDGLIARKAGDWAREKLSFLDGFMAPALAVAGTMPDRTYLDLFAGPGRNRTVAGAEFPGSPIRALQVEANAKHKKGFTAAHFVNYHRGSHAALQERVARLEASRALKIPPAGRFYHRGDTTELLPEIMRRLPRRGYVLAFADITGVKHWPWSSVEQLRAHGHTAVDLYMLFPLEMAINRFLSFDRRRAEAYFDHLDAFFGTTDWRQVYERRHTPALGADFRRELTELYCTRLRRHWRHVHVACAPGLSEARSYYRMLFATNHDAASRIATWASDRETNGVLELDL